MKRPKKDCWPSRKKSKSSPAAIKHRSRKAISGPPIARWCHYRRAHQERKIVAAGRKVVGDRCAAAVENKMIDELRARRGQLVAEYQEKSQRFRADYPAMAQLSNKIKEIEHQIGLEVKAVKSSLKALDDASLSQENEMKHRIEELRGETLDLQKRSIQYNTLNARRTRPARYTRVCCNVTRNWTLPAARSRECVHYP